MTVREIVVIVVPGETLFADMFSSFDTKHECYRQADSQNGHNLYSALHTMRFAVKV